MQDSRRQQNIIHLHQVLDLLFTPHEKYDTQNHTCHVYFVRLVYHICKLTHSFKCIHDMERTVIYALLKFSHHLKVKKFSKSIVSASFLTVKSLSNSLAKFLKATEAPTMCAML